MPSDGSRNRLSTFFIVLLVCLVTGIVLNGVNLRKITASTDTDLYARSVLPMLLSPNINQTEQARNMPEAIIQSVSNVSVPIVVVSNNVTIYATSENNSKSDTKPIIYIMLHGFKGRLGNYLMQYSAALGLARQIGAKLCITSKAMKKRASLHQLFQGPFAPACPNQVPGVINDWQETNASYQSGFVEEAHNCSAAVCAFRMVGFWSSYLYFDDVRDELRSVWNLTQPHYSQAQNYLLQQEQEQQLRYNTSGITQNDNVVFVGIHIRRGDMMAVEAYEIPDMDYYQRAMDYYRKQYSNVHFYIASDDKNWCRSNFMPFNETATVLPNNLSPSVELYILAQCRHVITSVGTFGWWSAYLSRSNEAIYPIKAHGKDWWTTERLQSFILPSWKGM
jgi:galactoside 2-L-fucosyltransferase 1/2